MSVPFIQIGQCGNQIGQTFYDTMFQESLVSSQAHQALLSQFFKTDNKKSKAKAFLIDMQPKVVNKNLAMNKNWKYDSKMSLVRQQGSGNNWAYGYNIHSKYIEQNLIEIIRCYAEEQDYIKCFFQLQSMAGGTGSGLGTYIIKLLNDIFPKTPKFIACVMPHLSGQVILQSYNACLSLGTVYQQADGIFIIQNDQMNQICLKELNIKKPSLQNINEVIGRTLGSVFYPVVNKQLKSIYSVQQNGFDYGQDLINNLFYDNRFKLSTIKSAPNCQQGYESFKSDTWQAIESQLLYKRKTPYKSRMLIYRGADHGSNLSPNNLFDKHKFFGFSRSGTLLQNGCDFINPIEQILERSYNMFRSNAYLHQYKKFGLEKQQMLESFAKVQNIQTCYKKL